MFEGYKVALQEAMVRFTSLLGTKIVLRVLLWVRRKKFIRLEVGILIFEKFEHGGLISFFISVIRTMIWKKMNGESDLKLRMHHVEALMPTSV